MEGKIMKNKPILSIVVPAYNALPYLEELVDSIGVDDGRKAGKLEVIIIDDGSTDGTSEYCDQLAKKNKTIKVFHQHNSGGPAGPRNLGIEKASGDYLFFADADDVFIGNAVSRMIEHLESRRFSVGIFEVDASDWGMDYGGLFEMSKDCCDVTNSKIMNSLGPYKAFKRSLIVGNGVRFPEGVAYEDLPFVMECYLLGAGDVSIISDRPYYKYTKREGTVSLSRSDPSNNITHGSMEKKIAGIAYYLSVAQRYCLPSDCPQIYERAMRYGLRNYSACLNGKGTIDQAQSIVNLLSDSYCDEVRSQFDPSKLISIDAMFHLEPDMAKEVVNAKDIGLRLSFWHDETNTGGGYQFSLDDKDILLRPALPIMSKWPFRKFFNSRLLSNRITEARLEKDGIAFSGEIGCLCDGKNPGNVRLIVRSGDNNDLSLPCDISELRGSEYGEKVCHLYFQWHCDIPLDRLDAFSIGSFVSFYVAFSFGAEIRESRFGHLRNPGVFDQFAGNAVLHNQRLLCPTETKWNNFGIRISSVNEVSSLPVDAKLVSEDGYSISLSIEGKKGFDNYKESRTALVLSSPASGEVIHEIHHKESRRGCREMIGNVCVSDLPCGQYSLVVRHYVKGGEFDQDVQRRKGCMSAAKLGNNTIYLSSSNVLSGARVSVQSEQKRGMKRLSFLHL